MSINVIPTTYQLYRFRSRLEARWAVFFDTLGLTWEYEKEGYELPCGKYLPDFWLPQVDMWAEIKPQPFTTEETMKCKFLAITTGFRCLKLWGLPDAKPYLALDHNDPIERLPFDPFEWEYALVTMYVEDERRFYGFPDGNEPIEWYDACSRGMYSRAMSAARAARFEFGESGYDS